MISNVIVKLRASRLLFLMQAKGIKKSKVKDVCLPSEVRSPPSIQQVISPLLIPAYLFRFDWIVCCSRYGQFLTAAETADLLAPDISAYNQVESWLSAGVSAAGNVKPNY